MDYDELLLGQTPFWDPFWAFRRALQLQETLNEALLVASGALYSTGSCTSQSALPDDRKEVR